MINQYLKESALFQQSKMSKLKLNVPFTILLGEKRRSR